MGSADGAAAVIGVEDDRLERALAESVGREAWVTEYRARTMPRLAEVKLYPGAQEEVEKFSEVRRNGLLGKVVALALNNVAGEVPGRRCGCLLREEAHVPYKQAADDRSSPMPMGTLR